MYNGLMAIGLRDMEGSLIIKSIITFIAVVCLASPVFAEQSTLRLPAPKYSNAARKTLSLKEAVLLALRNNPTVQNAKLDRAVQKFELEVAHNEFEPRFTVGGSANFSFSPGGKPGFTFTNQGELKTTLGTVITADLNNQLISGRADQPQLGLTITQPLLRGFGQAVNKATLLTAIDTEEVNKLTLKNTVIATVTQVINDYYALVESRLTLKANIQSLGRQKELFNVSKVQVKEGKLAPSDLVQQEADIASQKVSVLQQKNSVRLTKQTLLGDLGLDPQSNLRVDTVVHIGKLRVPDLDKSIAIAMENNITYLTQLINIRATVRNVLVQEDQQLWKLNATFTGTFNNRGFSGKLGPSTFDTTPNESLALDLEIPLDDKSRQEGLVSAKIRLQQARISLAKQKRDLKTVVINAVNSLDLVTQQIKVQKLEYKYSTHNYHTGKLQYKYGKLSYINLQQLQDQLTSSETSLISQRISYMTSLANFEQELGVTLEKWGIVLRV